MNNKIFSWIARILSILFICFLIMFSFDVFSANASMGEKFLGFLIHNIPSIILLLTLLFAWKYDFVGATVFYLAGIVYIVWFSIATSFLGSLILGLPAILVGTFYLLAYLFKLKKEKEL